MFVEMKNFWMWMMFQLSLNHKKLEQIIIAQQIVFEK